jgi:hypothetical protein
MFREVIEEGGETLLVDVEGRRLERDSSGAFRRGRSTEPASLPGIVRVLSDGELARRASEAGPKNLPEPVYRDPAGNVVAKAPPRVSKPRNSTPIRLDGATVTVTSLKEHVAGLLKTAAR